MDWCMNGATQFIATSDQTHSWDPGKQFSLDALTASSKAQEQQLCLGTWSWKRQSQHPSSEAWACRDSFESCPGVLFHSISLDPQPRSQKLKRCHHKDWELSRSVSHGTVMTRLSKVLCRVCQDIQPICSELILSTESTVYIILSTESTVYK